MRYSRYFSCQAKVHIQFVLSIRFCSMCLYDKKNITCWLEDSNFMVSWQKTMSQSFAALTRSCHSNIKFLSYRHRATFSIYLNKFFRNIFLPTKQILHLINNGNRTEWSPIRSVIIRVITKIGRPRSGGPIC